MISIFSLLTSVKDYVEVVHKIIESDTNFPLIDYGNLGAIITFFVISLKEVILNFLTLNWLKSIWDLPIIIPEISSAMISEISVLDGFLHNSFNFLDKPVSYGDTNLVVSSLEKFSIGIINSLFLFIPTSAAHIVTVRRFVIQGLEAGYLSGLGSIFGNILWISSIIFGWRFIVIPWVSLDIFRYILGFVLLIKYMWDSYNEKKINITSPIQKQKIFLLNFLLAFTEQTNIYPFISNLSIGSESSILETFPAQNYLEFISIHSSYIFGLTIGCLTLLHFTCWFWENPAFKIYLWIVSSPKFKVNSNFYYRVVNFIFLYLTMISAISSIPYYGLDYTLTNPLGFVQDDRILDQKNLLETSFLNTKASDRNTRRNRGRHGRRERWKRRIRKYRTFDASLYDQGVYDLFTIEDLNYGFDRFWLRRKMRNHRIRSRFFPGGWMRSFKKQLAKPRLESYTGPRQEFFRILFEQVYHPIFHEYNKSEDLSKVRKKSENGIQKQLILKKTNSEIQEKQITSNLIFNNNFIGLGSPNKLLGETNENISAVNLNSTTNRNDNLKLENSILRKFYRKANKRLRSSEINSSFNDQNNELKKGNDKSKNLYSKRWKFLFSQMVHDKKNTNSTKETNKQFKAIFENFYQNALKNNLKSKSTNPSLIIPIKSNLSIKKNNSKINLSNNENQILKYRSLLFNSKSSENKQNFSNLLHPLKYYLEKQNRYEQKLSNYTPTIFRKFGIENNAPYFRIMMNRYFYYYKPSLRWERTMKVASLRKARRKTSTRPKRIQLSTGLNSSLNSNSLSMPSTFSISPFPSGETGDGRNGVLKTSEEQKNPKMDNKDMITNNLYNRMTTNTHNYTIVGKKATRYRYQIYKDVLQHWYYSPFNRLLLKFDIDLFINRQPNSHFLTKEEENLLHVRRLLLSEHYDTLRWYAYMQHYRTMKTKIGGTKSFASRTYNQQFAGTFKKIRHLFAITPSQGNEPVLKFDQTLYNDKLNSSTNNSQKNLIIHEELLSTIPFISSASRGTSEQIILENKNLLNSSIEIVQEYLKNTNDIKQRYITKLIKEKNYIDLSKFLYKGKKTRGLKPILNEKNLIAQEKQYLLTIKEKDELKKLEKLKLQKFLYPLQENLWINLLKKWKRKINDQEFLKNYLQRRLDKRKKRNDKKEKNFQTKLERLENWFSLNSKNNQISNEENKMPSTGIEKALFDGIYTLKEEKANLLKNSERQNFKQNLKWNSIAPYSFSSTSPVFPKGNKQTGSKDDQMINKIEQNNFAVQKLTFKNMDDSILFKKEKEFSTSFNTLLNLVKNNKQKESNNFKRRINFLYSNFKKTSKEMLSKKIKNLFAKIKIIRSPKTNWQKTERALNKQKRSRKEFDLFSKKQFKSNSKNYEKYVERKTDLVLSSQRSVLGTEITRKKREDFLNETKKSNWKDLFQETYRKYFSKKFKRKKSPQRRSRISRNRGVTKKRTLSDSLKREFKNLRKYGEKMENKKEKIYLNLNSNLNKELNTNGLFIRNPLQRRSKQKKQRFWKQKRSKYSQKLRKYKKRRRSVLGKIRILNKQLKKIKSSLELKQWWWKNFLPNLRATTDSLWQYEKDRQIQQKLSELSISDILERDKLITNDFDSLQIGDYDYKPLSLPESLKLFNKNQIESHTLKNSSLSTSSKVEVITDKQTGNYPPSNNLNHLDSTDILSKISKLSSNNLIMDTDQKHKVIPTTNLPFYAGWDEAERKFIVTNRLLSRREAGYEMNFNSFPSNIAFDQSNNHDQDNNSSLSFINAPLKGMNAATTLYWQTPFTTYDPDQFFALGMDGFAPIGWRRFQFRHSLLKSWLYEKNMSKSKIVLSPVSFKGDGDVANSKIDTKDQSNAIIVKTKSNLINKIANKNSSFNLNTHLLYKLSEKLNPIIQNEQSTENSSLSKIFYNPNIKNVYRRLKKRYRRVKKHPRSPAWFPSGPLLTQVLPVHYIYIFYKRSRLPRDRYLKRRLQKYKSNALLYSNFSKTQIPEFTLRKRVKTKRKYHLKQNLNLSKSILIPRRMKFINDNNNLIRWRPLSRQKMNKSVLELVKEQRALKYQQNKKDDNNSNGNASANIRMKQLRRRVQRQIIRSVWRHKPLSGGFVWPGDYLKLELVKTPKLKINMEKVKNQEEIVKTKKKKKRIIPEAQIQSKKFLLEKHNSKVIKKKLAKAQRSNKIRERIKQINLII